MRQTVTIYSGVHINGFVYKAYIIYLYGIVYYTHTRTYWGCALQPTAFVFNTGTHENKCLFVIKPILRNVTANGLIVTALFIVFVLHSRANLD